MLGLWGGPLHSHTRTLTRALAQTRLVPRERRGNHPGLHLPSPAHRRSHRASFIRVTSAGSLGTPSFLPTWAVNGDREAPTPGDRGGKRPPVGRQRQSDLRSQRARRQRSGAGPTAASDRGLRPEPGTARGP